MSKPEKPREWTLLFKGDGYFAVRVTDAAANDFPKGGKRTCEVIEKSAYDKAVNALRSLMGFEPFQGLEPNRASEVLRELGELE